MLALWKKSYEKKKKRKKSYDQHKQHIKKQRHCFTNKGPSSQNYVFSSGHVWMWELDHKESWVLKNWCSWTMVLEKTFESPLDCKEIQPVHLISIRKSILNFHWKDWCWSWNSKTLATWCKELTHWQRPWHWERLKAGEGAERGWDGWMASPTQWTGVWVNSGSWLWTGKPEWAAVHGVAKRWTWLSDWTGLNWLNWSIPTSALFLFPLTWSILLCPFTSHMPLCV